MNEEGYNSDSATQPLCQCGEVAVERVTMKEGHKTRNTGKVNGDSSQGLLRGPNFLDNPGEERRVKRFHSIPTSLEKAEDCHSLTENRQSLRLFRLSLKWPDDIMIPRTQSVNAGVSSVNHGKALEMNPVPKLRPPT